MKAIGLPTLCFPSDHTSRAKLVEPDGMELATNVTVYLFFWFVSLKLNIPGSTDIFTFWVSGYTDTLYIPGLPTLVRVLVYLTMLMDPAPPVLLEAVSNGTAKDG